ncbi:MAG: type II/IV secretion system protein [Planctomycetes bacterium]|nr:type II/IV secretion system protein [Planctomycetota bacterium]
MPEDDLARHIATHFRLAVADLGSAAPQALKLVPERVARRYQVFPIREDDRQLVVATSDPTNLETEQALGFASGRTAQFEVAGPTAIAEAIDQKYSPDRAVEGLLGSVDEAAGSGLSVVEEAEAETLAVHEIVAAPVIKLTNLILQEAIEQGASDVHIEPGRSGGVVRFRVDGVLRQFMQMPMPALNRVVSRIKILGKIDIADRLRPQDGRARIRLHDHAYDLRISTVPTRDAEKVVIRILDPAGASGLDQIGLPDRELKRLRRLLSYRDGIVVVTGPTGSGKTTTLYGALAELATGQVNIMTVEDPVEYELPGITQIQVEARRGVTFPSALKAILRQDPDVILVGEIRDLQTAEVALQASLTGHLVLATLHTNDAVGAVARLHDLGLERAAISESLRGVVAQRLARRICTHCTRPDRAELPEQEARLAAQYGVEPIMQGTGCDRCGGTGYRGRFALMKHIVWAVVIFNHDVCGIAGSDRISVPLCSWQWRETEHVEHASARGSSRA